ncbi:MAG: hypothetical protein OXH82_08540 [Candidatus Dadabacteria bacterium]|nr:hypothetical protein [Candidatus Dadabacteria bacterium]MDE0663943.1 hypothetical protein [Candidatus Dadabacteria bacterium]
MKKSATFPNKEQTGLGWFKFLSAKFDNNFRFKQYKCGMGRKMKKLLLIILFFLSFLAPSYSEEKVYRTYTDIGELEEPTLTISQVLSSRDEFHRKVFTLEGQVGEIKFKEMRDGKKFTLFWFFEDDPEKRINVYARGFVEGIENGTRIRIFGWYRKHKRHFLIKRKNIMKAKKIHILQ